MERRPIRTRETRWAAALAGKLAAAGIRPNAISVASVVAALGGAACLVALPGQSQGLQIALLIGAAAGIQLRLLCNLLDGMVAVEGGLKTPTGDVYNDLPDRLADVVLLLAAGYGIYWLPWAIELGWTAALLAVMTAYVRLLAGATGAPQRFLGPMAKPHRMAALTFAALGSLVEVLWVGTLLGHLLLFILAVIVTGTLVTLWRRTRRLMRDLTDA